MKQCLPEGVLRAYLDGELPAAETMTAQLEIAPCRESVTRLSIAEFSVG